MIERKCLKCNTWNGEEQFCTNCGAAVAPEQILKEEDQKKIEEELAKPKDWLDILIERARGSKYLLVRVGFYMLYSVAFIVAAIGSFFAYLIAWSVG